MWLPLWILEWFWLCFCRPGSILFASELSILTYPIETKRYFAWITHSTRFDVDTPKVDSYAHKAPCLLMDSLKLRQRNQLFPSKLNLSFSSENRAFFLGTLDAETFPMSLIVTFVGVIFKPSKFLIWKPTHMWLEKPAWCCITGKLWAQQVICLKGR